MWEPITPIICHEHLPSCAHGQGSGVSLGKPGITFFYNALICANNGSSVSPHPPPTPQCISTLVIHCAGPVSLETLCLHSHSLAQPHERQSQLPIQFGWMPCRVKVWVVIVSQIGIYMCCEMESSWCSSPLAECLLWPLCDPSGTPGYQYVGCSLSLK